MSKLLTDFIDWGFNRKENIYGRIKLSLFIMLFLIPFGTLIFSLAIIDSFMSLLLIFPYWLLTGKNIRVTLNG